MKQKLWLTLLRYLSYCVDKELYKAIDYLKEQVRVLLEQQERQNKRILLSNSQRMRVAAKAKKLSRKMLEQCMYGSVYCRCSSWLVSQPDRRKI